MTKNMFAVYPDILKNILYAKFINLRSALWGKIIDISVWAGCSLYVTGYVMQAFGLSRDFGPFQLACILAVIGMFELSGNAPAMVADFEGDRTISYYLTLPGSTVTVLLGYIIYYATVSIIVSIAVLPLGKLILWQQLNLAGIAWLKFFLFLVLINLVWATATIPLTSYMSSLEKLETVWTRVIFPLWFLGCFQFSWTAIHATSPVLSYVMLLNPVLYATEGMRAVCLGQAGYLPFWLCFVVMVAVLIGLSFWGYVAFKKRLDLV